MLIRENIEFLERTYLSPFATLSENSKGRERQEPQCDIRPVFQRDRDRILHCKSFRRMKYKTQVFLSPRGDHYRTRLTHTLEVSQNARTIAKALRLNEDLAEAVALGHDLGHAPFGHAGERVLNEICQGGFRHIHNIVTNSLGKNDICMSPEVESAMRGLRKFMFDHVYLNTVAKREEDRAEDLLRRLFGYYRVHIELLPAMNRQMIAAGEAEERAVCDYIAGMTDRFAIARFEDVFMPKAWQVN